MTGLDLSPMRPVGAEDIRDLQSGTLHECRLWLSQLLQRTNDFAQQFGRHLGIQCGGIEPLVPKQHLNHTNIHLLLQKVGGKTVPLMSPATYEALCLLPDYVERSKNPLVRTTNCKFGHRLDIAITRHSFIGITGFLRSQAVDLLVDSEPSYPVVVLF